MPSIVRQATVSVINGQGCRDRAIFDATDQLNIAVRAGMRQMTVESMSEVQNVPPDVLAMLVDDEGLGITLPLKTWEDVEAFKAIPGVWAPNLNQWAHEHYKPENREALRSPTWRRVNVTISAVE